MIQFRLVRFTCLLAALLFFSNSVRAQGVRVFAQASGSYLFNDKILRSTETSSSRTTPTGVK